MHNIYWINHNEPLPNVQNSNSPGMIAAGFDLSVQRLEEAYSKGMFPWFSDGDPVLWWSPDPRMVLECNNLHVSKNTAKLLRRVQRFEETGISEVYVTTNMAFERVMEQCAASSENRPSTWITQHIKNVYSQWHLKGHVHSVEVWNNSELVGGLYGVALCGLFFGESMFSRISNMSKLALFYLVQLLKKLGVNYIDCQQETNHLYSMGARNMSRTSFLDLLDHNRPNIMPDWGRGQVLQSGLIVPLAN